MTADTQKLIRTRLNRIAGQISGLQKMVDDDRYCVDILTQIAAVRSALDAMGVQLLSEHMQHCIADHGGGKAHRDSKHKNDAELIEEMRTALSRFLK